MSLININKSSKSAIYLAADDGALVYDDSDNTYLIIQGITDGLSSIDTHLSTLTNIARNSATLTNINKN
jgi:hypothetical protein